ncbi:tripartite tricarboxylate transporter TctB family protein [Streptomyces scopuliridis]|uniref:tripartite tricarboxylate transporter TctB family protein n=1 Tax=Streptomyces scopuliridis TaxID=452529 RepID=UPI00367DEEC6
MTPVPSTSSTPSDSASTPDAPDTRTARRPVLAAYAVLTAVGALFFLGSFAYPWTNPEDGTIGAAALPRVAGLLLLLIGLALIRQESRTGSVLEGDGHITEDAEHTPEETRALRRKLVLVTAVMVVTALLIPVLGMLPALALMTLYVTASVEKLRWPVALATAGGVLGVSYLLFTVVLRVPLPLGLFDPAVWSTP